MNLTFFQFNLTRWLLQSDPALWKCPIQEGIPFLIDRAMVLLIIAAVILFLAGIILATFFYLTAFGNENKAKQGKETLKWTIIGALVIIFSAIAIQAVVGFFAAPGQNLNLETIGSECQST